MGLNEIIARIGTSVGLTPRERTGYNDYPPRTSSQDQAGVEAAGEVDVGEPRFHDILRKLSPSNRRLIRELAFKLATAQPLADQATDESSNLQEFVDSWLLSLTVRGRSLKTIALYGNYVCRLLEKYPSPTRNDLQELLAQRAFTVGVHAQGNAINAYRSFFTYLTDNNIITNNPAAGLKSPSRPLRERNIPPASDIARLLTAPMLNDRDRAIIRTLSSCGLRIGELLSLKRSDDVDLEKMRLRVIGKGNKQRSVPMTEETAACIQRYLITAPPSVWLFPGNDPTRPYSESGLDNRFASLCKKAKVKPIKPHQLRHYLASYLLKKGVNLKVVSQILGHASPSVTANVYWHLLDESEREKAYYQAKPLQDVDEEIMMRSAVAQLSFEFDIEPEEV
ncbi:MAG TPA: tyrosine-type recombinase/integrase [Dehalococcoidia bacterium]|nr:tyrosine-type recombinase/integrase [Dehalococcoidia bacterium]